MRIAMSQVYLSEGKYTLEEPGLPESSQVYLWVVARHTWEYKGSPEVKERQT